MSTAKRDQNRVTTAMGVDNSDQSTPLLFLVDPVTNRLLVEVYEMIDPPGIPTSGERDGNYVPTVYGINTSDQITPLPFSIEPSTNYLEVDLLVS